MVAFSNNTLEFFNKIKVSFKLKLYTKENKELALVSGMFAKVSEETISVYNTTSMFSPTQTLVYCDTCVDGLIKL